LFSGLVVGLSVLRITLVWFAVITLAAIAALLLATAPKLRPWRAGNSGKRVRTRESRIRSDDPLSATSDLAAPIGGAAPGAPIGGAISGTPIGGAISGTPIGGAISGAPIGGAISGALPPAAADLAAPAGRPAGNGAPVKKPQPVSPAAPPWSHRP
jgi:hypothetical protein